MNIIKRIIIAIHTAIFGHNGEPLDRVHKV